MVQGNWIAGPLGLRDGLLAQAHQPTDALGHGRMHGQALQDRSASPTDWRTQRHTMSPALIKSGDTLSISGSTG